MKLLKNMLNIVVFVIETLSYHTNVNGLVISRGYNVISRKHDPSKEQRKKLSSTNRLKYAELKLFGICADVFKTYEGKDYDKIYEILSTSKNKKLKINDILIEKNKDMLENPDFEQDYYSRAAKGIYKIRHDSSKIMKWLIYYN